jgi:molecular chaperone DnaK
MVSDAEKHAEEDKERREKIERRNRADSLAYQAEKQIKDMGDKIPADKKSNLQTLIVEVRDAIKQDDDSAIQAKETALQEALYAISSELYQQGAPPSGAPTEGASGATAEASTSSGGGDEDVIDAEFTETK